MPANLTPQYLEAEQEFAKRHMELQEAASDAKRLTEVYQQMQEAQQRVEDLYARWADLESKLAR